jgi:hypothetical protein
MTEVETHEFPTTDPRLGWIAQHDPRSRNFPVRLGAVEKRPRRWATGSVLDQGREGSCVGHGWVGELLASPRPAAVTPSRGHELAVEVYREAQFIDEWEGENYEGTSVLAGAKVVKGRGFMGEYRWAFSVNDVRDAVIAEGPVVIGIPWHESMYSTRPSGLVEVDGSVVGGHCLLITGYHPAMRIKGEDWHARFEVFRWRNSWGSGYGLNGDGFIRLEDLRDLLADWGESAVPTQRKQVRL